MRACLDTNVLIRLFVPHAPFSQILDAILDGRLTLVISNEILFEYQEVVVREFGAARWQKIGDFFATIIRLHNGIQQIDPHFRFSVITSDLDDNKFIDCAIAGEAQFIVTYDKDFLALRNSGYKTQPISPEELAQRL